MKVLIPMRAALNDAAVLGDALPGPSWRNWRILLIAAAGERLTASERRVFAKLTGRKPEPGKMVLTLLIVAGRRSGKTKAMSVFAVWLATCVDWSDSLSLGERGLCLFVSPVERQAAIAHRYAEALIDHVELFKAQVANRTVNSIELASGIDLETQAVNWRHSRGATCIAVALDESAFLRSADDSANSDQEIMVALKPALATTGGPMLLTSSPATMEGVVFKLFEQHHGAKGDPRVLVVQADSRTLNPTLRQDVIDRAFEEDASAASAEYGGQFRQPMSNYLERSVVQKCVDVGVTQRPKVPLIKHVGFVDVSGGSGSDSYACAIGHMQGFQGQQVCVIDALYEQRPPLDPERTTQTVAELLKSYSVLTVIGDAYGSQWPVTTFAKNGITYQAAPITKSEIYLHSLPLWTAGRVLMLDQPRAVDQLCALKRKLGQGGRENIDHVRGGHDDLANCIAGVLWRLTPVQQRVSMNALPVIVTSSYGCYGDNPRSGAGVSEYAGYTGAGASTRNPAWGLPRDARDSWERW
jgi:hypothetical protein